LQFAPHTSFVTQLEELANALDLIEERKQKNRGGNPVDRAMSYLSLQSAKAYRDCFGLKPTPTEGKPFERILANLAEIVGRHDSSTDRNVMHYVQKAIKDLDFVR
jgi:DNA-binding ferritin-like protein